MGEKIPLNIPNLLSLYRLLSFPFVLFMAVNGFEYWFVVLICINLVTDILDGLIARVFTLKTEIGARLDSVADLGTFILAFIGILVFKLEDFAPHLISFLVFFSLLLFCYGLSFIRFKRFPSMHLYSWKIGGYIQGIFIFVLFIWGFNVAFYYFKCNKRRSRSCFVGLLFRNVCVSWWRSPF